MFRKFSDLFFICITDNNENKRKLSNGPNRISKDLKKFYRLNNFGYARSRLIWANKKISPLYLYQNPNKLKNKKHLNKIEDISNLR